MSSRTLSAKRLFLPCLRGAARVWLVNADTRLGHDTSERRCSSIGSVYDRVSVRVLAMSWERPPKPYKADNQRLLGEGKMVSIQFSSEKLN